jgi:hypothetical protein
MLRIVVVVCFLGALFAGHWYVTERPKNLAMQDVKDNLVDPDSAKFSDVYVSAQKGGACGYVNAKNKMGGYAGDRQFLVAKSRAVYFEPFQPGEHSSHEDKMKYYEQQKTFIEMKILYCSID